MISPLTVRSLLGHIRPIFLGCVVHVPGIGPEVPVPEDGSVLPVLPLAPRKLLSVPTWADPEAKDAVPGDFRVLFDLQKALTEILPAPRHRLLGWCDTEDTPRPLGHRPLLQLEAEPGMIWGEVVNVSFWIREADLRAGELSRVRRSYEVA